VGRPAEDLAQLRKAEAVIVRLRWLAIASWPLILLAGEDTGQRPLAWAAYAIVVPYVALTHWLNRTGRAVYGLAVATTVADPLVTALMCSVTGGLRSNFFPFFYLTTLATSIRFGMRETMAAVALNAGLATGLHAAVPGATVFDLGLRVFYLFFVALEGGLLSREARAYWRQRQELMGRMLHAGEEERRRLAGEIHDRVGRRFFELHSAIERHRTAPRALDAPALERLAADARACADEVRSVTNALRPVVLDDFGFVEALREHAALLQAQGELAVALHVDDDAVPPAETGIVLWRVLQEALLNVRKHARARRVEISLARQRDGLALTVRDDGCGFDPAQPARGCLGLLTMRERAEACGGRLDLRSRPGSGTELRATVPAGVPSA
jgi:signal transduction histidine kinase